MQEEQQSSVSYPANVILLLCSWALNALSAVTAEGIYTWMFRLLSIISISLIIIINWKKAIHILFKKKRNGNH